MIDPGPPLVFQACPVHPDVQLPPRYLCPVCTQHARRLTYAEQRRQARLTLKLRKRTAADGPGPVLRPSPAMPQADPQFCESEVTN